MTFRKCPAIKTKLGREFVTLHWRKATSPKFKSGPEGGVYQESSPTKNKTEKQSKDALVKLIIYQFG